MKTIAFVISFATVAAAFTIKAPAHVKQVTQFQTCVWPHKCNIAPITRTSVAQVQPCVWPNHCAVAL